jgi:hypothetical protein
VSSSKPACWQSKVRECVGFPRTPRPWPNQRLGIEGHLAIDASRTDSRGLEYRTWR